MPDVQVISAWLLSLPPATLYAAAFAFAFIENIFPPTPSDVLIGVCVLIGAAGGGASFATALGSVLAGSVAGAAVTYAVARRYGAARLHAKLEARRLQQREEHLEGMYARYGPLALFIGRLIPGVRFLVPMLAGALRLRVAVTFPIIALAAALWYGTLTWIAFRVGGNIDRFTRQLGALGTWGAVAAAIVAAGLVVAAIVVARRRLAR